MTWLVLVPDELRTGLGVTMDDAATKRDGADQRTRPIEPGTPVWVASLYDGRWHPGFVVRRTEQDACWLVRGDGTVLPAPVPRTRVAPAPNGD